MTPEPAPDAPLDPAAARAAKRIAALDEMMDMSLRAARVVDAEIAAFAEGPRGEDSPRTVERLTDALHATARCLRLTVALQAEQDQDAELLLRQRAEAVAQARALREAETLERRRTQTRVAVEQAIEAKDGDLAHSFAAQEKRRRAEVLIEREYADRETFLERSTGALIAQICRRVGLHPDFTRWKTAWAEDALAATPPPPPPPPRAAGRNRRGAVPLQAGLASDRQAPGEPHGPHVSAQDLGPPRARLVRLIAARADVVHGPANKSPGEAHPP